MATEIEKPSLDVRELVHEADLGRRKPVGITARVLAATGSLIVRSEPRTRSAGGKPASR